jgi:hypothetical protein
VTEAVSDVRLVAPVLCGDRAVDPLAQQIGMAIVASVFGDHMDHQR